MRNEVEVESGRTGCALAPGSVTANIATPGVGHARYEVVTEPGVGCAEERSSEGRSRSDDVSRLQRPAHARYEVVTMPGVGHARYGREAGKRSGRARL